MILFKAGALFDILWIKAGKSYDYHIDIQIKIRCYEDRMQVVFVGCV